MPNANRNLFLSAAVLALGACVARGPSIPLTEPAIEGRITALDDGVALVVGSAPRPGAYDRAAVRIDDATVVLRSSGGRVPAHVLAVGQPVRAWFDGPVMESYPVQAHAGTIVIDAEAP